MNIDNQSINSEASKRWIEMVQKQLIRENPSALPDYGVDGSYGPETVEWVKKFQSRKGLVVDGNAGPNTLATFRSSIALLPDMNGRGVELLQEDLLYFYIEQSPVDGNYGPKTEQGVRDFQYLNGLKVDGNAGPNTLKKMDEYITTIIIRLGDNGSHVRRIQNQLNDQDEVPISIAIDGNYGPATESSIQEFQKATEQRMDGVAGPVTLNLLDLEATNPSSEEDIMDYLAAENVELEVTKQGADTARNFGDRLNNNSAFVENIPTGGEGLSDLELNYVTMKTPDGDTEMYQLRGNVEHPTSYIYLFASFDSTESLVSYGFLIAEGDAYDSPAIKKTYDVNGEMVESSESSIVELTNEELEIQKEITKSLREASSSFQTASVDLFSCEATVSVAGAVVCGAPGLFISGVTASVLGIVAAGYCGYLANEIFVDDIC